MRNSKLLAALQTIIDKHWEETDVLEFDQLLTKLEGCGRIRTIERQSLRLRMGLKKLREESSREENAIAVTTVTPQDSLLEF